MARRPIGEPDLDTVLADLSRCRAQVRDFRERLRKLVCRRCRRFVCKFGDNCNDCLYVGLLEKDPESIHRFDVYGVAMIATFLRCLHMERIA
jgi:hypothetical protein